MKYHKLPTRKNIGRGYTISIKLITPTELAHITNETDSKNYMGLRPIARKSSAGAWIDTTRTIYIDKSLTKQKQWEVYWHEMLHAILDIGTLDRGGI